MNEYSIYTPNTLNLIIDQPYTLRLMKNYDTTGKHTFTAKDFFKTLVWRKAQDTYAEVK